MWKENRLRGLTAHFRYSRSTAGAVLGPLIFLLYVNDFQKKSKVTLSLFNLQTILVFYVDMNPEKQLQQKLKKIDADAQLLDGNTIQFEC